MVNYFFDSYAIIELLEENPSFMRFSEFPLVTTVLNKMEVVHWGLVEHGEEFADILVRSLQNLVPISDDLIKSTVIMKKTYAKRKLSYADCLGYCFAQKNGLIFLTGDKEFKDLPGVEFVK